MSAFILIPIALCVLPALRSPYITKLCPSFAKLLLGILYSVYFTIVFYSNVEHSTLSVGDSTYIRLARFFKLYILGLGWYYIWSKCKISLYIFFAKKSVLMEGKNSLSSYRFARSLAIL